MEAKICVLITHYNNLKGLLLSVNSIDEDIQVDLLIIDDGSKSTPSLSKFNYCQGKINIIIQPTNKGPQIASNIGLKIIKQKKYSYVGRLDAGDICLKNRFTKQIRYLEQNKDVYLLGTWVNVLDKNLNHQYILKHPTTYIEIKKKMYFNLMFVHPSIVFRTQVLDEIGYYPEEFDVALDYAYIFKIVKKRKAENLPEVLLNYVIEENSISSTRRKRQVFNRIRVIWNNFYFGYYPIVGLVRNFVLLLVSRNLSEKIKKAIKK